MMFCCKCGTQVRNDAAFCQKCGTKLITDNTVLEAPAASALQPAIEGSEPKSVTSTSIEDLPEGISQVNKNKDDAPKKSETVIHGHSLKSKLKIKVYCNEQYAGTVGRDESIAIPILTDSTIKFKGGFVKKLFPVKYGESNELKIEISTLFGSYNIFDLHSPYCLEKIEKMKKRNKVLRIALIAVVIALFLKDGLAVLSRGTEVVGQASKEIVNEMPDENSANPSPSSQTQNTTQNTHEAAMVNSNTVEVMYEDIPVSQFFEMSIDEAVATLGTGTERDEYKIYGDIDFHLNGDVIESGESMSPEKFSIGGATLEKNRSELIDLLGNPSSEGESGSGYEMTFEQAGYNLTIATGDKDGTAWRIFISSIGQQGNDSSLDSTEYVITYDIQAFNLGTEVPDFLAFVTGGEMISNESNCVIYRSNNSNSISYYYGEWDKNALQDYGALLERMGFEMLNTDETSFAMSKNGVYILVNGWNALFDNNSVTISINWSSGVVYKGERILELLGSIPAQLRDTLGDPTSGTPVDGYLYNGGEYYGYDGILFIIDYQTDVVGWIVGSTNSIELNGVTLDKTGAELIDLLGTPTDEGWTDGEMEDPYYYMQYDFLDYGLSISISDPDSKAYDVMFWRNYIDDGLGNEEYPVSDNYIDENFEWVEQPTRSRANTSGGGWELGEYHDPYYIEPVYMGEIIEGVVRNISGETFNYVQITYTLFDSQGNQVGTAMDAINNLGAGSTWKFSAAYYNDHAVRFEFAGITAW